MYERRSMKIEITVFDGRWSTLFKEEFIIGVEKILTRKKVKEIIKKIFEICLRYNKNDRKADDKKSSESQENRS